MMRKISLSFCLFFLFLTLFSQEPGYKIKFEIEGITAPMLYIKGNYGHSDYIFDSVEVTSKAVFLLHDKRRTIPDGIYKLVDGKGNSYLEFIISQNREFSVKTDATRKWDNYTVEGSDENKILALVKRMEQHGVVEKQTIHQFIEVSPESLLSKYLKAQYLPVEIPDFYLDEEGTIDENATYRYLVNHFFDNIDFNDARLLHTPIDVKLDLFFTEILLEQPVDTIISEIDKFIEHLKNEEVKSYYLQYIYMLFDTGLPKYDAVLVHLYDYYCPEQHCEWLDEHFNRRLKRDVLRKRVTLPGQIVPPLEAYAIDKKLISSDSIDRDFTILWFWDPDCEDCIEETPKLYKFYEEFHDFYDFEVIAISITEDYERWARLIPQFSDWINLSFAMGEPNYDFVDYFDLLMTPGIFVIDKDHKIIARQFPLEEILRIFEN